MKMLAVQVHRIIFSVFHQKKLICVVSNFSFPIGGRDSEVHQEVLELSLHDGCLDIGSPNHLCEVGLRT